MQIGSGAPQRVGTLDAGTVGSYVDGTLRFGDAVVRWWIRGATNWIDPSAAASRRDRRIDGMPVVESVVRAAGGDVVVVVGAVVGADGDAAVAVRVENPTADPIAIALVLESPRAVRIAPGSVDDGRTKVVIGRDARASLAGPDAASLFAAMQATDPVGHAEPGSRARAGALVVPVPHRSAAVAVVGSRREGVGPPDPDEAGGGLGEGGRRLAAAWRLVVDRGPGLDWGDETARDQWVSAVSDALLGPSDDSVADLARSSGTLARLGHLELATRWLDAVLVQQRANGSFGASTGDTSAWLALVADLWCGGIDRGSAEDLLGPVGAAIEWLTRKRVQAAVAADPAPVAQAFARIVPFLVGVGQPELAAEVATAAGTWGWRGPVSAERRGPPDRWWVAPLLDDAVRETATGLDLAVGWTSAHAGRALSMSDVPTRWGRVSWALRWHGARPAVLWELVPHADRTEGGSPEWTLTAIDARWVGTGDRGEGLLEAPVAPTMPAGPAVRLDDGGSFS